MTPQNSLEIEGNLSIFPLAELLIEIEQAGLDGSLRFSLDERKIIIYFQNGKIVYAISNARVARLFDLLLRENKIDKTTLTSIENFTNDFELGKALVEKNLFSQTEIDAILLIQIEEILRDCLTWKSGKWNFNPLARIREGIRFQINTTKILADYARSLAGEAVSLRFRSSQEKFSAKDFPHSQINLQPHEAFVFSRFEGEELTIEQIKTLSGLPDGATFQTLYVLWLGGCVTRHDWHSAFSEGRIAYIKTASISLKHKASAMPEKNPELIKPEIEEKPVEPIAEKPQTVEENELTLEEYLAQNESATNHYEVLGVDVKADSEEIKKAYFKFAKRFHPDIYHRSVAPDIHRKIQNAFTKLAGAHENLRDKDLREIYDYKLRKEIAQMEERRARGKTALDQNDTVNKEVLAEEQFNQGYNLFMDELYAEAVPFLARAVHLDSKNARYHAFFGKILAQDPSQRHKAEGEIQTAIKLDPTNELYRIISAEFFIQYNLIKRAEGELKRLLAIAPDNREAQTLLDSLQNK